MTVGRKIISWGGHTINDDNPSNFDILDRTELPNSPAVQTVKTPRPGNYPLHVMGQPDAKVFRLEVNLSDWSAANWDEMQGFFDPALGQQRLVSADLDGTSNKRYLDCFPLEFKVTEGIETNGNNFGSVTLEAAYGQWQALDLDSITDVTGVGDGDTFDIPNDGNTRSYPAFTITPTAAKDDADGYTLRRRVVLASQTEMPMGDPVKDGGYPIDFTDGGLDTATLEGAGKVRADLFDLVVALNGELLNRWPDPATDDAATKLWANTASQAMKSATLGANISDADTSLVIAKPYSFDFDDWPKAGGFVYVGTELLMYASRDAGNLYGLTRGIRGTTAASHTAGDAMLWVEHRFLDLLYGKSGATDPAPPDDEKPLIDLASSTNVSHVSPDAFLNERDRRSRAFQRRHTDAGTGAQHVRQYGDGISLVFENNQAAAGKPALNDAVMEFPVPLSGPLVLDIDVDLTMLIRGYVEDLEGYESKLIDQDYTASPLSAQSFSLPNVVKKLRLTGSVGVVVGQATQTAWPTFTCGATDPEQYQKTAVRFTLTQKTKITKIAIATAKDGGASGDLRVYLMDDGGGLPAVDQIGLDTDNDGQADVTQFIPHVLGGALIANADMPTFSAGPLAWQILDFGSILLDAGTYWLSLARFTGGSGNLYVAVGDGSFVTYVEGDLNDAHDAIAFLVFSDETDPQEDAPLDNGDTVQLANITAPLDTSRRPLIALQAEEAVYDLRAARLKNETNGTYIDLTWPMALNQSLSVDTKTHRIIDLETGLDVPFVGQAGSGVWPYNDAGANTWSWTESGATGLTIAIDHRGEWL